MIKLIGFTGKKGSGKDTCSKFLSEISDFKVYALAYPIKQLCRNLFNFTEEHLEGNLKEKTDLFFCNNWEETLINFNLETLSFLQLDSTKVLNLFYKTVCYPVLFSENSTKKTLTLKTSPRVIMQSIGTEFGRTLHSNIWIELANIEFKKHKKLIISDVRFDNEAEWIINNKGVNILVKNDEAEKRKDKHTSEQGISKQLIKYTLENNSSKEDLKNGVASLYEYFLNNPPIISL